MASSKMPPVERKTATRMVLGGRSFELEEEEEDEEEEVVCAMEQAAAREGKRLARISNRLDAVNRWQLGQEGPS